MAGKSPATRSDEQSLGDDRTVLDAVFVKDEDSQASAEAQMSARHTGAEEDTEEQAAQWAEAEEGDKHLDSHDEVLQLAQAGSAPAKANTASDAPLSVGDELLRQAEPLPSKSKASRDNDFDAWLKSDWGLPLAIGGGALALLGLAAGGGGGGGGGGSNAARATPKIDPNAIPSNMYGLTVMPAAGPFTPGAAIRVSVQKLMADGSWKEISASSSVDATGRLLLLVEKIAVSASDMLRVTVSDSNPNENDYTDEVSGPQSLGNVQLQALIGGLSEHATITVNPLTTVSAKLVGADLSSANVNAVNTAVARAFGIKGGDLIHTLPALLTGQGGDNTSADATNYGLALGLISGMTQAQRDAHAAAPLQSTLDLLASIPLSKAADGSLSLDLSTLRQNTVEDPVSKSRVAVGLDAGAAKLYAAAQTDGAIANAQVPYVQVNTKREQPMAGQVKPDWSKGGISYTQFIDGLTLKVTPAASAQFGDTLLIEFTPLKADGTPVAGAATFSYRYIYTEPDVKAVQDSSLNPSENGVGSFSLVLPTYDPVLGVARPSNAQAGTYLFNVDKDSKHYQINPTEIAGYQLRASGALVGLVAAGATFNVDATPVAVQALPGANRTTFNGEVSGPNNTITVFVALDKAVIWDSQQSPTLKLVVTEANGNTRELKASYVQVGQPPNSSNVLKFALTLNKGDLAPGGTGGLEGTLSVPGDALDFPVGTVISDVFGNTLFTKIGNDKWENADNKSELANITAALGARTTLNTALSVDTKPPADPVLNLPAQPPADAATTVPSPPVSGRLNAEADKPASTSLFTNELKQAFKVTFAATEANMARDVGAKVILKATSETAAFNILPTVIATTIIKNNNGVYEAVFTSDSYDDVNLGRFITKATQAKKVASGLTMKFTAQVIDAAGNQSKEIPLTNNIIFDLNAPAAPSKLSASGGIEISVKSPGDAAKEASLVNTKTPTIAIQGDLDSFARVMDESKTVLAAGWLKAQPDGTNSVELVIGQPLAKGVHTLSVSLTDAAGNEGPAKPMIVSVLPPQESGDRPTVTVVSTSAHGGVFKKDDVIKLSVKLDREVFLKVGKTAGDLKVNLFEPSAGDLSKNLSAKYESGLGTDTLNFSYQVSDGDDPQRKYDQISLLNWTDLLRDAAGSNLHPDALKGANLGAGVFIDTIAPQIPVVALTPEVDAHGGSASKSNAQSGVLTVAAENNATVALTFTNTSTSKVLNKQVTAGGPGAPVKVALTTDEIAKLGDGVIKVTATAADAATNTSAPSNVTQFTLDTVAPTVTAKTGDVINATIKGPAKFTVTFSEALDAGAALGPGDFSVTNGVVQSVNATGSNQYTVMVTANANVAGGGKIDLSLSADALARLKDIAGNPVTGNGILASQLIDTRGPQVTSVVAAAGSDVRAFAAGKDFDVLVTFDEKVDTKNGLNILGPANFRIIGGGAGAGITQVKPSGTDGKQFLVTVAPGTFSIDDVDITLALVGVGTTGSVVDALDNLNDLQQDLSALGGKFAIDATAPSLLRAQIEAGTVKAGNPGTSKFFHAGDTITASVTFDERVVVSSGGQPSLQLSVGSNVRTAQFDRVQDGKVYFKYILTSADNAADGIGIPVNALSVPAGTRITDAAGNSAKIALAAAVAPDANYKVDNVAPVITDVKLIQPEPAAPKGGGNVSLKAGDTVEARVTFNETVHIDDHSGRPKLTLDLGGGNLRRASYVGLDDKDPKSLRFEYEVAAGDNAPGGVAIPAHALALNGATIIDGSGNNAVADNRDAVAPNATVVIDTQAPSISKIVVTAPAAGAGVSDANGGLYGSGAPMTVTVTFNEALVVKDAARQKLTIKVGDQLREADYVRQSTDNKSLDFQYVLRAGDNGSISVPADTLKTLSDQVFSDVAGNFATALASPAVSSPFKADTTAPTIIRITSNSPDGTYNVGRSIDIRATASEALRVGANVVLTLDNGDKVELTRDSSDSTLLTGTYKVEGGDGHASTNLTVKEITAGGRDSVVKVSDADLAGNPLTGNATSILAGQNLGDLKKIVLSTITPGQATDFRLAPGSDLGSKDNDGITSENKPGFSFKGLTAGATVKVTALVGGLQKTLLEFTATGVEGELHRVSTALADGTYTEVKAQQIVNGNPSIAVKLDGTSGAGTMRIDTQAPPKPDLLIYDAVQDTQVIVRGVSPPADPGQLRGIAARDFRTTTNMPVFDFKGGRDGDTALLFLDKDGNGKFDVGEMLVGKAVIGDATKRDFVYPEPTRAPVTPPPPIQGHSVQANLDSGVYSDIALAFESPSGVLGPAIKANFMPSDLNSPDTPFQIVINSKNSPHLPASVTAEPISGPISAKFMTFTFNGTQPGVSLFFVSRYNGQPRDFGNTYLDINGKATLDISALKDGEYKEIKVILVWNNITSDVVEIKKSDGTPLDSITIDRSTPTVSISTATANTTSVEEEKTIPIKFTFSTKVKDFDASDVVVTGGTLSNVVLSLDGGKTQATADFTAARSNNATVSLKVKPDSYSSEAGKSGQGSAEFTLPLNHQGTLSINGATGIGPGGAAGVPRAGDRLLVALSDPDRVILNDASKPVSYLWSRPDDAGIPTTVGTADSYVLAAADVGKEIKVSVTYSDALGNSTLTQAVGKVIPADDPGRVDISSTGAFQKIANPGNVLTAKALDSNGINKNPVAYQWLNDGNPINGATTDSYQVMDGDLGHQISVRASYTDDAGNRNTPTSALTLPVKAQNSPGRIEIGHQDASLLRGAYKVGQVLVAPPVDDDGVSGNVSYAWFRGADAIAGATGPTYTLVEADKDQQITVKAQYTDDHGYAENLAALAVSVSSAGNSPPTGNLSIDGQPEIGSVLTVSKGTLNDPDGFPDSSAGLSYKWFMSKAGGQPVPISADHLVKSVGDGSQLQLTSDLVDATISVQLSYRDRGGSNEITSAKFVPTVSWAPSYKFSAGSVGFTDGTPQSTAQLIALKGTTRPETQGLYILDVNGDGQITAADATTFVTGLDASGSIGVKSAAGTAKARLLTLDAPTWQALINDAGKPLDSNGTANGKFDSVNVAKGEPPGDFWTSTAGIAAGAHMVFSQGTTGSYSKADSSFGGDPARLHYSIFQLSVIPA